MTNNNAQIKKKKINKNNGTGLMLTLSGERKNRNERKWKKKWQRKMAVFPYGNIA